MKDNFLLGQTALESQIRNIAWAFLGQWCGVNFILRPVGPLRLATSFLLYLGNGSWPRYFRWLDGTF
jgi:hypothetical protein